MIKQVTINNNYGESMTIKVAEPVVYEGEFYDASPEVGIFIAEIEGLGPVKANINMSEVATQHGARFNSWRGETRDIIFHFLFFDINGTNAEECRLRTYRYFPLGEKVILTFKTENRTVRTSGYVESNEPDIFAEQAGAKITVSCPSSWFSLVGGDKIFDTTISNLDSLFEFEFEDPFEDLPTGSIIFSSYEERKIHTIYYYGEVETGMDIKIIGVNGSFRMPIIYNNRTNEFMKIDTDIIEKIYNPSWGPGQSGLVVYETCQKNDEIWISTTPTNKYVKYYHSADGTIYNVLSALTLDSSWLKINPSWNKFSYTCSEGSTDIEIHIEANVLIGGV